MVASTARAIVTAKAIGVVCAQGLTGGPISEGPRLKGVVSAARPLILGRTTVTSTLSHRPLPAIWLMAPQISAVLTPPRLGALSLVFHVSIFSSRQTEGVMGPRPRLGSLGRVHARKADTSLFRPCVRVVLAIEFAVRRPPYRAKLAATQLAGEIRVTFKEKAPFWISLPVWLLSPVVCRSAILPFLPPFSASGPQVAIRKMERPRIFLPRD